MNAASVEAVAVLGLGTMGHSIAQAFAAAGCRVRCYDTQAPARDTAAERIHASCKRMAEAGVCAPATVESTLQRIEVFDSESMAVSGAQFVTEAILEDLAVKQDLFARIESAVATDTILASNSSSFPMSQIATKMRHPRRAILTHWFNPPHLVPVVEVVPGGKTAESTTRTTIELLQRIGKSPVRLNREIPGFLVNRVQMAMYREIWDLLERGIATAEDIDRAIRGSMGFRLAAIGPLEINDFAGLDVVGRVYERLMPDMRRDTQLPRPIRTLLEKGRFGVKTGAGIYDYPPETIERKQAQRDRRYLALMKLLQDDNGAGP